MGVGAQESSGKKGMGKGAGKKREVGVLKGWEAGEIGRKYAIEKEEERGGSREFKVRETGGLNPLVNTQQKKTGLENRKVRGGEKAKVKVRTAVSRFKASLEILFFAHARTSYADVFHLKLNGRPRSARPVNGILGAKLASKSLFLAKFPGADESNFVWSSVYDNRERQNEVSFV